MRLLCVHQILKFTIYTMPGLFLFFFETMFKVEQIQPLPAIWHPFWHHYSSDLTVHLCHHHHDNNFRPKLALRISAFLLNFHLYNTYNTHVFLRV